MPRTSHTINDFSGGTSNDSDPRDIRDNEFPVLWDVIVDNIGEVSLMGAPAVIASPDWNTIIPSVTSQAAIGNITLGYGFSVFASDYHVTGSSGSKNFVVLSGLSTTDSSETSNKKYFISRVWEDDGVAYEGTIIINSNTNQTVVSATDSTYAFQPNYYYADGALRICDGNFSNTSSVNKWFGYIKRNHFTDSDVYDDWYSVTNAIAAPTRGIFAYGILSTCAAGGSGTLLECSATNAFTDGGSVLDTEIDTGLYFVHQILDDKIVGLASRTDANTLVTAALSGTTTWKAAGTYVVLPPVGTGFNLGIAPVDHGGLGEGTWPAGDYEFASTFIYDDKQESKLFELIGDGNATAITAGESWYWCVTCQGPFSPRITGGRIYTRIYDSSDDWILLVDIDLNKGWRIALDDDYTAWHTGWSYSPSWITGNWWSDDPNADTYKSLSGINDPEKDMVARYKTAVVVNRRAYIGNVYINGKKYEDSIFKSFVNRFDTFTEEQRLDVAINDGDAIIKLETYADRILEFKKKAVYIINVSQEVEFLEDTKKHIGIDYPFQTVNTEYGIVWINSSRGCYLYNGNGVIDLLLDRQDPRRRKLSLAHWRTFTGTYPAVAYEANNKRLYVFSTLSGARIDVYMYDFITGSWTRGVDKYDETSAIYTNPLTEWDGGLQIFNITDNEIYEWSDTAVVSSNFQIRTKDFDFGLPGIEKILYFVKITYAGTGVSTATNVQVRWDSNGGTSFTKDFTPVANATLDSTISELDGALGWTTAILKPDTASESHGIYSMALKLFVDSGQSVDKGFKINDISFVFRVKGVR